MHTEESISILCAMTDANCTKESLLEEWQTTADYANISQGSSSEMLVEQVTDLCANVAFEYQRLLNDIQAYTVNKQFREWLD